MTRSEAIAPLRENEARFPVELGLLVRGQVRRVLTQHMIDFYEEKGLLESTFIIRGPIDKVRAVFNFLKHIDSE